TPFTSDELEIIATEYKMFVDPEIALIAEVDGKPAAMCFAIPDVNEMVKDFDGELMKNPLNLARLLWRLKFRRLKHARLLLLGVTAQPASHIGLAPGLRSPARQQARQAAAGRRAARLVPPASCGTARGRQALASDPERRHRGLRRDHPGTQGAGSVRDFARGA